MKQNSPWLYHKWISKSCRYPVHQHGDQFGYPPLLESVPPGLVPPVRLGYRTYPASYGFGGKNQNYYQPGIYAFLKHLKVFKN